MSNAADIRVKPAKIMLDRERNLILDLNAFICLEEEYGSIDTALDDLTKGKVKAIRAIVWAGLVHEDEGLTVKDVGKLLTLANLQEVAKAVNEALTRALPKPEKNAENPPQ